MRSSTLRTTISVVVIVLLLISLQVVTGTDINLWEREPQATSPSPSATPSGSGTTSASSSPTSSNSGSGSSSSTPAPTTSNPYGPTIKNTTSTSPSGTNKPSSSNNSTSTASSNSTLPTSSVIPTQPVSISVIEPENEKNILCKIGSNITFAWKYLSAFGPNMTPKYINVYAQSLLEANKYYNISTNAPGDTTKVIWDSSTETSLPVATYKLYICDERGINANPSNGRLSAFSGLQFKMYSPRPVVPLEDYQCPTCYNQASISIPYIPLLVTLGVSLITIISFSTGL